MLIFELVLLIACVLPQPAFAASLTCEDLFSDASFVQSESYRKHLDARAGEIRNTIHQALKFELRKYRQYAALRYRVTPDIVLKTIESSKTLRAMRFDGFETLPEISSETLDAMYEAAPEPTLFRRRLENDPYFIWLKHNSLEYKVRERISVSAKHGTPLSEPVQITPADLYLRYREAGLNAEMALIQLEANLDPTLLEPARQSAQRVLLHFVAAGILRRKIQPYLSLRDMNDASAVAWSLMPSLTVGREALRKLVDTHVATFQTLFPRTSFERVLLRAKRDRIAVIAKYDLQKKNGVPDADIVKNLEEELLELRRDLGIQPSFPLQDLYGALKSILARQADGSYESFLISQFHLPGAPLASAKLMELRRLVEIAETLDSEKRAAAQVYGLAQEEAKKFNFKN